MKKLNQKYKGWDVKTLEHQFLKLHIAPELGGRIIQIEMQGYEYLFNNPLLIGKKLDTTRLGDKGAWLNFGGEKIWPAPQGWDTPEQWSGPPDPVLDSGIYEIGDEIKTEAGNGFTSISPVDNRTGLQIKREIILEKNRSAVNIQASFINKSNKSVKWSVWPVVQINTPGEEDDRYRVICPVNLQSKFDKGYKVMHGLANNPQNGFDDFGNVVVSYGYLVGKIGFDSDAGWMAFFDTITGKTFILLFDYKDHALYPEDTSMQVWTMGRGMIFSRNRIAEFLNDKTLNPPYLEMEILSPIQEIEPESSIHFNYKMLCTTISPCNKSIYKASDVGIIAAPMHYELISEIAIFRAQYGVFNSGKVRVVMHDKSKDSQQQGVVLCEQEVSPFSGVDLKFSIKSGLLFGCQNSLSAFVYDIDDNFVGTLEQIKLNNHE